MIFLNQCCKYYCCCAGYVLWPIGLVGGYGMGRQLV